MTQTIHPLQVTNVRKRFGDVQALNGVTFSVAAGEVCGLLGPNGAGKSTLMRCITTLLAPDEGTIECFGHDTRKDPRGARGRLGYTAQTPALDKVMSGREHLELHAALYHVPRQEQRAAIDGALDLVGLQEAAGRRVGGYSGGMARRLDLAAALLHGPELLVLDEPTVGLDIHSRTAIWSFIRRIAGQGTAVLLASHHTEEIETLATRILIVDHGKIAASGTAESLKLATGRMLAVVKTAPYAEPAELAAVAEKLRGNALAERVFTDAANGGRVVAALREGTPAPDEVRRSFALTLGISPDAFALFGTERPSLDDVFLQATGHGLRDAAWAAQDAPMFPSRRAKT